VSEPAYGPTGAGTVILDVGGQIGALILHTPAGMAGAEIEISQDTADGSRTHACVRERTAGHRSSQAAVYTGLRAGTYTVWSASGAPLAIVRITGGQVTHHSL
jgi:hypothetical protein